MKTKFIISFLIVIGSVFPLPAQTPLPTPPAGKIKSLSLSDSYPPQQIEEEEAQSFAVDAKAGFFLRVEVKQKGLHLLVSLTAPDGRIVAQMDAADGWLRREVVSHIAEKDGAYRIDIKAYAARGELSAWKNYDFGSVPKSVPVARKKGTYEIKLSALRPALKDDEKQIQAEKHLTAGIDFNKQASAKSAEAVKEYESAAGLWRESGDKEWEAIALSKLGSLLYFTPGRKTEVRAFFDRAAKLFKETNDTPDLIDILGFIGEMNVEEGEFKKAKEAYELLREFEPNDVGKNLMLGAIYYRLSEFEKAASLYRQIIGGSSDPVVIYIGTNNLGEVYRATGKFQEAIELFKKILAAPVYYSNRDFATIGILYSRNLLTGIAYDSVSKVEAAAPRDPWKIEGGYSARLGIGTGYQGRSGIIGLPYPTGAVENGIARLDVGATWNNLGLAYYGIGEYAKAGESLERAISGGAAKFIVLNNLAITYKATGDYDKAAETYLKNLNAPRATVFEKVFTLNNLGGLYEAKGELQKSREYLTEALKLAQNLDDLKLRATTLNNLGSVSLSLEDLPPARIYLSDALELRKKIDDLPGIADTLNNLGSLALRENKFQEAQSFYEQSLFIRKQTGGKPGEAIVLNNLMALAEREGRRKIAALYGKQAVNLYQQIRRNILSLSREDQDRYAKSIEKTYRALSDNLVADGRFPEAQAVLDLLKKEEFALATRSGEMPETVPYSREETAVIAKIENRVGFERERGELQKIQKETGTLSEAQLARLAELDAEIDAANRAFQNAFESLGRKEVSVSQRVDEIKNSKELQGALARLGTKTKSGVVALYTVLGTEEKTNAAAPTNIAAPTNSSPQTNAAAQTDAAVQTRIKFGWIIMVTPNGYKAYPIDTANLEENIFAFHRTLVSDRYDPQPLAEKIYTSLFRQKSKLQNRTLEEDLQDYFVSQKDKTLMWSLDGVLRYIPMAALHDGKNYLVENYRSVLFTKNSFVSLAEENQDEWNALGVGVSEKREDFAALPAAKTELENIVREPSRTNGVLKGTIRRDADFQKLKFLAEVRGGGYSVVHIASHYSFNPVKTDESFLLLGDGHLRFSEMNASDNLFGSIDLLTLSACDTAVSGNGKEAEGFAYLAQKLGAKSVIASLWKVSDSGTSNLMINFYKLRAEHPEIPKGEIFRQAQLLLLAGENSVDKTGAFVEQSNRSSLAGSAAPKEIILKPYTKDEKKPFAHPFYWASFVLIGNWR